MEAPSKTPLHLPPRTPTGVLTKRKLTRAVARAYFDLMLRGSGTRRSARVALWKTTRHPSPRHYRAGHVAYCSPVHLWVQQEKRPQDTDDPVSQ